MTAIVRKFNRIGAKGWPIHNGPRSNVAAIIEAAEREADEQESDTSRLCREARDRVEQERRRDQER